MFIITCILSQFFLLCIQQLQNTWQKKEKLPNRKSKKWRVKKKNLESEALRRMPQPYNLPRAHGYWVQQRYLKKDLCYLDA